MSSSSQMTPPSRYSTTPGFDEAQFALVKPEDSALSVVFLRKRM